jgi:hypothetical protein
MKKKLLMLLTVLFTMNACKKSYVPEPEALNHNNPNEKNTFILFKEKTRQEKLKEVSKNVKDFSKFLEKKRISANTTNVAISDRRGPSNVPIQPILPGGGDTFLPEGSDSQLEALRVGRLMDQIAVPESLSFIDDNLSPQEEFIQIEKNVSTILNTEYFTSQSPTPDPAVSQNLATLSSDISAIANNELELANIDPNTIANQDLAMQEIETRLNSRIQTSINNNLQSTNFNIGLTPRQINAIQISSYYALQALQTPVLMEEISIAVNNALNTSVDANAAVQAEVFTKGLFRKVGKFLTQVIKAVAVVAWAAVVIGGAAALAFYASGPYDIAVGVGGFVAAVTYVSGNGLKWWKWVKK